MHFMLIYAGQSLALRASGSQILIRRSRAFLPANSEPAAFSGAIRHAKNRSLLSDGSMERLTFCFGSPFWSHCGCGGAIAPMHFFHGRPVQWHHHSQTKPMSWIVGDRLWWPVRFLFASSSANINNFDRRRNQIVSLPLLCLLGPLLSATLHAWYFGLFLFC